MVSPKSELIPGPQSRGPFYARKRGKKVEVVSGFDEKVIAVVVSPAGYANGDALQIAEALNVLRRKNNHNSLDMKRDFELIRKLLIFFESKQSAAACEIPKIEGYDNDLITQVPPSASP